MGETSITMRGRRGFELHTRVMAQPWGTPGGGFSPAGGAGVGTTDLGPRPPVSSPRLVTFAWTSLFILLFFFRL